MNPQDYELLAEVAAPAERSMHLLYADVSVESGVVDRLLTGIDRGIFRSGARQRILVERRDLDCNRMRWPGISPEQLRGKGTAFSITALDDELIIEPFLAG